MFCQGSQKLDIFLSNNANGNPEIIFYLKFFISMIHFSDNLEFVFQGFQNVYVSVPIS